MKKRVWRAEKRVEKNGKRVRRLKIRHARKKFIYKLVLVLWIILFLIALFFLIVFVVEKLSEQAPPEELEGELKTAGFGLDEATGIYFPENCTTENLTETWKSIFFEREEGVTFVSDEDCKNYLMYKPITLPGSLSYACIIYGENFEGSDEFEPLQYILAMCGSLMISAYSELISINSANVGATSTEDFFKNIHQKVWQRSSIIDSEPTAAAEFASRFRVESGTWHKNNSDFGWECVGGDCYLFNSTMLGSVYTNLWLDGLFAGVSSVYTCTDSDGGINYSVKGTCSYAGNSFTDNCDGNNLWESRCSDSGVCVDGSAPYACPNGCTNGKCTLASGGNSPPIFIPGNCSSIGFEINTNYTLNTEDCFYDEDGDTLVFNYTEMDISNISITRTNNYLNFLPDVNFSGVGSFYIFANDSINETKSEEIRVNVSEKIIVVENCVDEDDGRNKSVAGTTANSSYSVTDNCDVNGSLIEYYCNGTAVESEKINCGIDYSCDDGACVINSSVMPVITNSTPQAKKVSLSSNESKTFTISATNYDSIKWYLDDELVSVDVSSYEVSDLAEGNHTLKVEVTKGSKVISKIWDLVIAKEETPKRSYLIYFVIIFVILGLLAIFIIFFIIRGVLEKKETKSSGPIIQLAPQQKPESALPGSPKT